jgi:hypothetical protein
MVKTKFKIEIIWLCLIILILLFFIDGVVMIEQLRWIAHILKELIDADSFI